MNDNRGYVNQGGFNNSGPIGPSPECFAAIQSGDFVKAKEICSIPANPYQPPYQPQNRSCAAIDPIPCPEGQYREQRFADNCPVFGQCLPIPGYQNQQSSAPVNRICPARPEIDCQSGYQKFIKRQRMVAAYRNAFLFPFLPILPAPIVLILTVPILQALIARIITTVRPSATPVLARVI